MKFNIRATVLAIAAACTAVASANVSTGSVSATTAEGRSVEAFLLSPNIIKVTNTPIGSQAPAPQIVLDITTADSVSSSSLEFDLDGMGGLTITDRVNGIYLRDSGERDMYDGKYVIELSTNSTGSFYGAGERGHKYNLRGDTLVNYNRQNYGYTGTDPRISQMNITMPLFLSSDGFAIVFDDRAASTMELGNPVRYITESNDPITYYYVGGVRSLAELTEQLSLITGRQPLPPFWAMGYITSKYGYKTSDEAIAVADTFKTHGYPLDGMVLDLYWFGREQDMGRLDWDRSNWPDPAAMIDSLRSRNINLITVSEPYVLRNGLGIDNYNELAQRGMFVRDSVGNPHEVVIWVGEGGMFDVSNPDTRAWLRDRYKMLTDIGVAGWWGDLGEPEVHPETGYHANGLPARLYHNQYGNDWSSIISELFASEYPDRRLMTLMRGGTAGLQRHCVFPWSTDVSRSWGGLEPQIRIMLNSGLSGLGYMSSDLGGFAVDNNNPYIPELYVRWVEAGLFTPVFRTHAQQYAEPYLYPQYENILLGLVKERYRWLPYNYTLAYENATKGWPLVRPLDFYSSSAGRYDDVCDQYLWGPSLMVAPVLTEGATSRRIVFPDGSDWIDYADPMRVYRGGTVIDSYPAPLDVLPLFVRAGAIIPTADYHMESTAGYRADHFTINYYPAGVDSHYTLYDDNRMSPASLAEHAYRLIDFSASANAGGATVDISSCGTYSGAPGVVYFDFKVNGMSAPATVTVGDVPVDAVYDPVAHTVSFSVEYIPGRPYRIAIDYHK